MNDAERRSELAHFLRTRRERLSPVQVDLPRLGRRRRTPGLRREELAQIADVSLSWYIKLEQGQDIQVSVQVLESLSRALQFTADEQLHLFALARQELPLPSSSTPQQECSYLKPILDSFLPNPAFVTNERWDVIARNQATVQVFTPSMRLAPADRNLLWLIFTHPAQRKLFVHWEAIAQRMLALFRMSEGLYREDVWFLEQRDLLMQASSEFRAWWSLHDVNQAHMRRKELNHPVVGSLVLQSTTLQVADAPHLKLFLYTPLPEEDTASKLIQLVASP
ncbi:helix-turn-helix transcriptional regulator [Ktedonospora formicarum]|uniref:Transcriptional regulator n=1 Tax=Ktedonospora formicarum TaxID=2778364 RepID=A0A8J3I7P7_9CHLR|nr:helix-turn-helix transcriptional regulator [Ktedonospora formicarum]GHO48375.1 transcriptional regulator [Ktedonospora formicarum]